MTNELFLITVMHQKCKKKNFLDGNHCCKNLNKSNFCLEIVLNKTSFGKCNTNVQSIAHISPKNQKLNIIKIHFAFCALTIS